MASVFALRWLAAFGPADFSTRCAAPVRPGLRGWAHQDTLAIQRNPHALGDPAPEAKC